MDLARELLLVSTSSSETTLLHEVTVRQTLYYANRTIVPYSLHFRSYEHFENSYRRVHIGDPCCEQSGPLILHERVAA